MEHELAKGGEQKFRLGWTVHQTAFAELVKELIAQLALFALLFAVPYPGWRTPLDYGLRIYVPFQSTMLFQCLAGNPPTLAHLPALLVLRAELAQSGFRGFPLAVQ